MNTRALLGLLLALVQVPVVAAVVGEAELGRSIFERGIGRDAREINATLASSGVRLRGAATACAGCHGQHGAGGGEGWIVAPDLRWFALSKPYGARRVGGRPRLPYRLDTLRQAVNLGIGSDGVDLDPAMPRFDLAEDEVEALIEHLRGLDQAVTEDQRRPPLIALVREGDSGFAARLVDALSRCPLPVASGADPPRTLPTITALSYSDPQQALADLAGREQRGELAAVFAPDIAGWESAYSRSLSALAVPTLLPVAMLESNVHDSLLLFRLPGIKAQALALVQSLGSGEGRRLSILDQTNDPLVREIARHSLGRAGRQGWAVTAEGRTRQPDAGIVLAPLQSPERYPADDNNVSVLLVPSLFMVPQSVAAWRRLGVQIRVALPYPPQPIQGQQWVAPEQAWLAIGCELLAYLPPMPVRKDELQEWRAEVVSLPPLRLGNWLDLPARSGLEVDIGRVHIVDLPGGPAGADRRARLTER